MVLAHDTSVKTIFVPFLIGLFFLLFPNTIKAEILINEFSSNSDIEWVELYNNSVTTVDLTNWTISDDSQAPELISGTINGGGFFVFERPEGWLNNSGGDSITLKESGTIVRDTLVYGKSGSSIGTPDADKSAGRTPNGSSNWQNNLTWSKSDSNPDQAPIVLPPSPSPSPNPAPLPPSPSPSLAPSPIPSKSPSPVPSKPPSPKPSKTPVSTPQEENLGRGETLGVGVSASSSPSSQREAPGDRQFPLFAISLIAGGLSLVGLASFLFFRSYQKDQKQNTEEIL